MRSLTYLYAHGTEVLILTLEHLEIVLVATLLAFVTAVPLGVWIARRRAWAGPVLALASTGPAQGDDNKRNRQFDVYRAHDDLIHNLAIPTGGQSQEYPEGAPYSQRYRRYQQGNTGTVDNSRQDIPPQMVSTEQERGRPTRSNHCIYPVS